MRLGLLLSVLAASLAAQSQPIVFTAVGPLTCGMRLYTPQSVQTYCLLNSTGATLCNALDTILPSAAVNHACNLNDPATPGLVDSISWLVYAAAPPNTTGAIRYQISSSVAPCSSAPNPVSGLCAVAQFGPVNFVSGSFGQVIPAPAGDPEPFMLVPVLIQLLPQN